MYLTIHTPTSLIIGTQIHEPLLAFIFAFLGHLILDIIPHDHEHVEERPDKKTIKKYFYSAIIDLSMVAIFLLVLWQNDKLNLSWSILAAIVGGILPDFLWGIDTLTQGKNKILSAFHHFHNKIHRLVIRSGFIPLKWVILVQAAVFVLTLFWYLTIYTP